MNRIFKRSIKILHDINTIKVMAIILTIVLLITMIPAKMVTPAVVTKWQNNMKSVKANYRIRPDTDYELKSTGSKIKLKIPKGLFKADVDIEIGEYTAPDSTGMQILHLFELKAFDADNKEQITKFKKELEITIEHDEQDLVGLDIDSIRLCYFDEEVTQWVAVKGTQYDKTLRRFSAKVDHFTVFGEMANPTIVGSGKIMVSQLNLNSGTATYTYPIELPAGPGGFKPTIELTYNSGAVDEMKSKRAVSSWVGIGWSLKLGSISYDSFTDRFFLDLPECSYQLVTTDGINFRTNPDLFYKITRNSNTWEMLDTSGNYYRFGGTTDSEQYIQTPIYCGSTYIE
ncbi:MAG: hypothetical protein NTV30_08485, partial [Chloroflexi bacterium]|nr:hypothetical protein [Chloroflexota bacterium]